MKPFVTSRRLITENRVSSRISGPGWSRQTGSTFFQASRCAIRNNSTFRLPKLHRDHLQSTYNGHMLHSSTTDPFKLALYKLMGKIDPSKRTVPDVTVTTEDWLWFQLAMVRLVLDNIRPDMNYDPTARRRRTWRPTWSFRCCLWLRSAALRWAS